MFDTTLAVVMLFSLLACAVTTFGIHLISKHEAWARNRSIFFVAFAAGLLLTVSLLHIAPKALRMNASAPALMLVGFLALCLLNRLLHLYLCPGDNGTAPLGLIPMLGIGLHSFIDGCIYSVTFSVSILTGVLAATGMVLHEIPEGIVVYVALQRGRFRGREAWTYAFLSAGATTPLGALIAYPFAAEAGDALLGGMLAASAGALLYVSASHLLPQVEEENRASTLTFFAAGVVFAVLFILVT